MIRSVAPLIIALFVLTGGFYLIRLIRDRNRDDRILNLTHLLMSIMMIMMPFGWSVRIPAGVPILTFTAAALWYVHLLLFRPHAVSETVDSHHSARPRLLYHTGMMLAMVWMAVIMAPVPGGSAQAATTSMPGMSMPGLSVAGRPAAASPPTHGWADPVSIAIGAGFGLATVWYLLRLVRVVAASQIDVRKLTDDAAAALMAAGMALSNLVVIT